VDPPEPPPQLAKPIAITATATAAAHACLCLCFEVAPRNRAPKISNASAQPIVPSNSKVRNLSKSGRSGLVNGKTVADPVVVTCTENGEAELPFKLTVVGVFEQTAFSGAPVQLSDTFPANPPNGDS
jgi:hypothetical protein